MELLAPAGNLETFWAAVEKGADAVYIGWENYNARVQAENFTLKDIGLMIPFAHRKGVKVYIALNILFKEHEIPEILEGLQVLESLSPDALIIQDMGVFYLLKRYFPSFKLHGSTLMTVHNSLGAEHLRQLGFERAVLARELSLDEIRKIAGNCSIQLEVFAHGALCYSFSGLCLMSSYLGGKSSLRGRCVQPCRRLYWNGKKRGYFFSMNDLCTVGLIPRLRESGVTCLKLEGRMRSAHYVSSVVEAYRLVLDNPDDRGALERAEQLIKGSLGRKTTPGYLVNSPSAEIINPQFSGSAGLFTGKITRVHGNRALIRTASSLALGDRMRIVRRQNDEQQSFTIKAMGYRGLESVQAAPGQEIMIEIPIPFTSGDLLFKVDEKTGNEVRSPAKIRKLLSTGNAITRPVQKKDLQPGISKLLQCNAGQKKKRKLEIWVKLAGLSSLLAVRPLRVDRILVRLDEETFRQYKRFHRKLKSIQHLLTWAFPPVIDEHQVPFYKEVIPYLCRAGFKSWNLGHISQRLFFSSIRTEIHLSAGYTCNVLNSISARSLQALGIKEIEFSIETDFENLKLAMGRLDDFRVGLTVYGSPPLFTGRLTPPGLERNPILRSPKKEFFKAGVDRNVFLVRSIHPYSILPSIRDLERSGLSFAVLDFTLEHPDKRSLSSVLNGKLPDNLDKADTFNFWKRLS
ncbi:MAG: peptidase U32 family protein [Pseudomonadota bacterium]